VPQYRQSLTGLAGEVAHLTTAGVTGQAVPFTEVFADLGLRQPGSAAIDVSALLGAPAATRQALGQAVSGVLAAIVALADPELIVIGGPGAPSPPCSTRSPRNSGATPGTYRSAPPPSPPSRR
jgi:hypothetical protein